MKKSILFISAFLCLIQQTFATSVVPEITEGASLGSSSTLLIFALCILIVLLVGLIFFLYSLSTALPYFVTSGYVEKQKAMFDFTNAVPIEREHEILMDHCYDGIQELDNNLPTWWVWMFYATIVFAFGYFYYYQTSGYGDNQIQEYEKSLIVAEEQMKLNANRVDENSATVLTADDAIQSGKLVFEENCAACHGKLGEGGIGPNFADNYWLHGGDVRSIFKTIKNGVPDKGMISWKSQLSPVQIQEVASYILTFKGTNPPNAKEPQGDLVE